jgi:two-component system chemotaxis response regulator CheB
VLTDIDHGDRYRCRVGHAWTAEALVVAQADAVEHALWTGLRALEEKASLCHRLASLAWERRSDSIGERYEAQAQEAVDAAAVLRRQVLARG